MVPSRKSANMTSQCTQDGQVSAPFKPAPSSLKPFYSALSKKHVYIAHVDSKPWKFKRKIFMVPVAMNVVVALLFCWRVYHMFPWYAELLLTALHYRTPSTVQASAMAWSELAVLVLSRAFYFLLDFLSFVFVWPWPVEFVIGGAHGSPAWWRWRVGFRDKEIYVRRSRSWDRELVGRATLLRKGAEEREALLARLKPATAPTLLQEKTGFLTMNADWDLDWAAMVHATKLVHDNSIALAAFRCVVLVHVAKHGWLCVDLNVGDGPDTERRRQIFAFRDALVLTGKEHLFYEWIEIVQRETSQPSGFGAQKQVEVAKQIRQLFASNGVNFDELWKESVGECSSAGLP